MQSRAESKNSGHPNSQNKRNIFFSFIEIESSCVIKISKFVVEFHFKKIFTMNLCHVIDNILIVKQICFFDAFLFRTFGATGPMRAASAALMAQ